MSSTGKGAGKSAKDAEVNLSLNVVNQMISAMERQSTVMKALHDEVKKLQEKGGQKTLA